MKSIKDLFKTDARLEEDGVDLSFGEYGKIRVARSGGSNKDGRAVMERVFRPYRQVMTLGALDKRTELELTAQATAEGIVRGWEIVDENGAPVPFSVEACKALFVECPDLLEYVITESQRLANFTAAQRTDEGKDS